jgi:hypothetical protein
MIKATKLKFSGTEEESVYNITAPFIFEGKFYLFGREEPIKGNGLESKVSLFKKKKNGFWEVENSFEKLNLEDPFIAKIKGLFILGGVEVRKNPKINKIKYRTIFYKGKNIFELERFSSGPWGMKDIRLVELNNGEIGVFTRPQGKKGARGKIGFMKINSLEELTPRIISKAQLIKNQFAKGEWGGVNQAIILKNGKIGVLGHIARYSKDKMNRFYYAIVFCFDPETSDTSNLRLILRRAELPEGESKNPGLYNVIFPGGIIRKKDGTCLIYAGVGDLESYRILIKDPFKYYEEHSP